MRGAQIYSEGYFIVAGAGVAAIVMLALLARSFLEGGSNRDDRATRLKRVTKVGGRTIVILAVLAAVCNYGLDANLRRQAHDCKQLASDDRRYIAELCSLQGYSYVGRVFEGATAELLIERTFSTPEPDLAWFQGDVLFERGGDESAVVKLPPSLYERVLAKFP